MAVDATAERIEQGQPHDRGGARRQVGIAQPRNPAGDFAGRSGKLAWIVHGRTSLLRAILSQHQGHGALSVLAAGLKTYCRPVTNRVSYSFVPGRGLLW